MIKTVIVLPDGTELTSGVGETNNIRSATITQSVNSGTDLTIGSVCASVLEASLQTPYGVLSIDAGTEVSVYQEDELGDREKIGLFTLEKPTRSSANGYSITAYDRITWLDKDLTGWLAGLNGWPYSMLTFARMVAQACGVILRNTSLLNGDYQIQKFSATGITGRKLMEWIGQICVKFCRATPDGEIEFSWYTNRYSDVIAPTAFVQEGVGASSSHSNGRLSLESSAITSSHDNAGKVSATGIAVIYDDGNGKLLIEIDDGDKNGIAYFGGSLSYEDYEVSQIQKVQIRLTEDDVGTIYPQISENVNTYVITGNYLLTSDNASTLRSVAEGVYKALSHIRYTPSKVSVQAGSPLKAGDMVQITDINGKTITAYLMTKIRTGQRDTFECTGSPSRDSVDAVNEQSFKSISGKLFEVRKSTDGLNIRASETDKKISEVDVKADGITASVSSVQQQVIQNQNTSNQQFSEVSGKVDVVSGEASKNAQEITTIVQQMTSIQQKANEVSIEVQSIKDNGVSKVTTGMGYTFNELGLKIQKPGEAVGNLLDNTGMYVTRSDQIILQANASGVVATDVKVNNYLIVGEHARFEDYSNGSDSKRTACFWI